MKEAVIGFIGVLVGSAVPWIQSWHLNKKERDKNAHYSAIRIVVSLRQYIYKCWLVAVDDGLAQGQRDADGSLFPQSKDPGPIIYPDDIDWKSLNQNLSYELLTLPLDAETADQAIEAAIEFDGPPDYEDVFEERHAQYSKIGLKAIALMHNLCEAYALRPQTYNEQWNPAETFAQTIEAIQNEKDRRSESNQKSFEEIQKILTSKKDK